MGRQLLTPEQIVEWESLKGNLSLSPTYIDLAAGIWNVVSWYYRPNMWSNYHFPQSFIDEFTANFYVTTDLFYYIVLIAVIVTLLRYQFERVLCKPLVERLRLLPVNKRKFPESAWKCLFYTCTWLYSVYLLRFRYNYFQEPYYIWDDWEPGMDIPFDIRVMYFIQCGFYLHSIYGTLYMDSKRKDFYAMLVHHVLTMTLIFVSYAARYHKIGLLVLFVHDITDVWLELTKVLHYLAEREGKKIVAKWEIAANIGFVLFTLCWFLFRLYWYPIKVLYSTGVAAAYRAYNKGCGLYGFFNGLLWILLGLNIYWLYFILQFLFRFCTGKLDSLQDVREDEEQATFSTPDNAKRK